MYIIFFSIVHLMLGSRATQARGLLNEVKAYIQEGSKSCISWGYVGEIISSSLGLTVKIVGIRKAFSCEPIPQSNNSEKKPNETSSLMEYEQNEDIDSVYVAW